MLMYSNLQQASDELSRRTGRAWTQEMLLDFAWHVRIPLSAATPSSSVAVVYTLRDEHGRVCFKEKFRLPAGHQPLVHLFPWQIAHLIIRGEVLAKHVHGQFGQLEEEITLFDPEIRVTPAHVRLSQEAFKAVLQSWGESQAQPEPMFSKVGSDGVTRQFSMRHRLPTWVFDKDLLDKQLEGANGVVSYLPVKSEIDELQTGSLDRAASKAKKKKRVRHSPEVVRQLHDDYIKSNNGSDHGATLHVADHLGKSPSWVKLKIREAKKAQGEDDKIRSAAGLFGQLLSGGKK